MTEVDRLVGLMKNSGPDAGALGLAAAGLWGGQFAAKFAEPYVGAASLACVVAIYMGFGVVGFRLIRSLFGATSQ